MQSNPEASVLATTAKSCREETVVEMVVSSNKLPMSDLREILPECMRHSSTKQAVVTVTNLQSEELEEMCLSIDQKTDLVGSLAQGKRDNTPLVTRKEQDIVVSVSRASSYGKLLTTEGFAILKGFLYSTPAFKSNMQRWTCSEKGGTIQQMSTVFARTLMEKDNINQGGFLTLRDVTLSEVIEKWEQASCDLKALEVAPAPITPSAAIKACRSLIGARINLWPVLIFWCHSYRVLSRICEEKAPYTCKRASKSAKQIKNELHYLSQGSKIPNEPTHDREEHKRYAEVLREIAALIGQLKQQLRDTSCLQEARGKKFVANDYATYFSQDLCLKAETFRLRFTADRIAREIQSKKVTETVEDYLDVSGCPRDEGEDPFDWVQHGDGHSELFSTRGWEEEEF